MQTVYNARVQSLNLCWDYGWGNSRAMAVVSIHLMFARRLSRSHLVYHEKNEFSLTDKLTGNDFVQFVFFVYMEFQLWVYISNTTMRLLWNPLILFSTFFTTLKYVKKMFNFVLLFNKICKKNPFNFFN